jgi:hypothetical protein
MGVIIYSFQLKAGKEFMKTLTHDIKDINDKNDLRNLVVNVFIVVKVVQAIGFSRTIFQLSAGTTIYTNF